MSYINYINNNQNTGRYGACNIIISFDSQVTDVDSPTGDHALIDIGKLVGLNPRAVTVRTKSRDSQSGDSQPTAIPSNFYIEFLFCSCVFVVIFHFDCEIISIVLF